MLLLNTRFGRIYFYFNINFNGNLQHQHDRLDKGKQGTGCSGQKNENKLLQNHQQCSSYDLIYVCVKECDEF